MDKIKVIKFAAGVVVSAGLTKIVGGFVRNNTCPTSMRDKITIVAASVAIGSLVARAVLNHTNERIDEAAETWEDLKKGLLNLQETISGEV